MHTSSIRLTPCSAALRMLVAWAVLWSGLSPCVRPAVAGDAPCGTTSSACGHEAPVCLPRTQDEVWLVSSRCLGCPNDEANPPQFQVWQYDLNAHQWNSSTQAAFLASNRPALPTVFWVHGNRKYADEAREDGMEVYDQLTTGVSGDRPIRFVIYSWPAVPVRGLREDAREKAIRTNADGYYLAALVNQIDPHVSVDLIGYSFGARIVTGALHILGGGDICGWSLPHPIKRLAPLQAVLVAPAVNNDWLAIGHAHGKALVAVDRMLSLNNYCDRALKHYAAIDPCTKPVALGYTGAVGYLGENGSKLRQFNMCCAVGKQHYWGNYFYNPGIVAMIRPYVGLGQ
ncbi:MAG TPA: hypothetical protein VMJ32_17455 [Pirellulales bacterium]|nr:hypothetical protein [Pirellulales bacterium]